MLKLFAYFSENTHKKIKIVAIHFLVWFIYLSYSNLVLYFDSSTSGFVFRTVFNYTLLACVFYTNANLILDNFIPQKRYFLIFILTIILVSTYTLCRYFLQFHLFPLLHIKTSYKIFSDKFYLDAIWLGVNYILYSYGYWYARHTIRLERDKAIVEVQKAEAEIAFLQTQINPHFLYNTLNFMYSQAVQVSDKLAISILSLSDIMRYTITEAGKKGTIPLEKEIEHIENYIRLQQFRFNENLAIDFVIEGEEYIPTMEMLPLVLISFVENAFKHGDLSDKDDPLMIHFVLTKDSFKFFTKNKKSFGNKEKTSGIGMVNIKKRLELIYGENHSLKITDSPLHYASELNIFNL